MLFNLLCAEYYLEVYCELISLLPLTDLKSPFNDKYHLFLRGNSHSLDILFTGSIKYKLIVCWMNFCNCLDVLSCRPIRAKKHLSFGFIGTIVCKCAFFYRTKVNTSLRVQLTDIICIEEYRSYEESIFNQISKLNCSSAWT